MATRKRVTLAQIEQAIRDVYAKTGGRGPGWEQAKRAIERFGQGAPQGATRRKS
jgi:hypothetical protein